MVCKPASISLQTKNGLPEALKTCSIRELARRVGVSDTALHKARAAGRIPDDLFGVTESGRPCVLDPDAAAEVVRAALNVPVESAPVSKPRAVTPKRTSTDKPKEALPGEDVSADELPEVAVSRKRLEHFKALQAELEYRRDRGMLVEIEQIAKQVEAEYAAVRTRLLAMKVTLAPDLIALDDVAVIQSLIERYVTEALQELTDPDVIGTTSKSAPSAEAAS